MLKNIIQNIEKIIKVVSQLQTAGGLVLSDSSFKYLKLDAGRPKQVSLRLPPGLVEDGRIKNRSAVAAALRQLKNNIEPSRRKKTAVVVSLENSLVYSQIFTLPYLEGKALKEAALLNLQIISPLDIKRSYYGYEIVDQAMIDGRQLEFLGAFIPSEVVDEWTDVLREVGFTVAAIEFQALGLVRELVHLAKLDPRQPYVALAVSSEGVDFIVIKNNHLYFDYFYSWKFIQGENRQIAWDDFIQMIIREMEKVLHFTASRFGAEVNQVYLITQGLSEEIKQALRAGLPKIRVEELIVNSHRLSPGWIEALGAARRGQVPRSRDNYISLSAISVLEEYYQNQTLNMLALWRNIFTITFAFFILVFGVSDLFLRQIDMDLREKNQITLTSPEAAEFETIKERAEEFNKLVRLVGEAKRSEKQISPLLAAFKDQSAKNGITLTRITIQSLDQTAVLNGLAPSQAAIVKFKNELSSLPQISEVNLPLASLVPAEDGWFSFSMSLKIKGLDF